MTHKLFAWILVNLCLWSSMFNYKVYFSFRNVINCIGTTSLIENRLVMGVLFLCKIKENPDDIRSHKNFVEF